ncbi:hypothetical protein DXV75_15025 [Alteromonas aestuariivivens]|uniref:Bacteriophage T5 Orf172 DNA-binding domain-containing protein n=1 Tax=Alteromonas aestuariivivens TaxID=1938339 RepID=A0A3D8M3V3_9ALTE|nr:GIY-YIG nuclease family protein [Alteromonas aestuariivivens]RDV24311.1 hypothetical protein DXV75_15025 [Alteromonas aestuariivivens]
MLGRIYIARPRANTRFCKIGMTSGREVTDRMQELNSTGYGGFCDWEAIKSVVVINPLEIEKHLHTKYREWKVPLNSEQEVFVIDDIELLFEELAKYNHLSVEEHQEEVLKIKAGMAAAHLAEVTRLRSEVSSLDTKLVRLSSAYTRSQDELRALQRKYEDLLEKSKNNYKKEPQPYKHLRVCCTSCAQRYDVFVAFGQSLTICPNCKIKNSVKNIDWSNS